MKQVQTDLVKDFICRLLEIEILQAITFCFPYGLHTAGPEAVGIAG